MTEESPQYVIHRHAIPAQATPFTLPIYDDAEIVHVGMKGGGGPWGVNLWERHRTDIARPKVIPERTFRVVATGEHHSGTYRGTFIQREFVFHLIQLDEESE